MFYMFHQNNSGGFLFEPAANIIVEADSIADANIIASHAGLNPDAYYCDCCGRRWRTMCEDNDNEPNGWDIFATKQDAIRAACKDSSRAASDNVLTYIVARATFLVARDGA